jgi:hypothetical protein
MDKCCVNDEKTAEMERAFMNQKFNQRFKETENHIKSQLLLLLAENRLKRYQSGKFVKGRILIGLLFICTFRIFMPCWSRLNETFPKNSMR